MLIKDFQFFLKIFKHFYQLFLFLFIYWLLLLNHYWRWWWKCIIKRRIINLYVVFERFTFFSKRKYSVNINFGNFYFSVLNFNYKDLSRLITLPFSSSKCIIQSDERATSRIKRVSVWYILPSNEVFWNTASCKFKNISIRWFKKFIFRFLWYKTLFTTTNYTRYFIIREKSRGFWCSKLLL